jgi:hypothetical protein
VNNDHTLTAIKDRLAEVRDSLGEAHPSIPASEIVARARRRRVRRRVIAGLTGVLALAAGAAVAVAALLPASHPASHQPRVQLAAWTVVQQPGGIIHVTISELRDPAGLQATLRADGVPASVSFGNGQQTACLPYPGGGFTTSANPALINSVFPPDPAPGPGVSIRPSALPSGTGVLLAFLQRSQPGVPFIAIEAAVVQASQQCTGS